jgi:hypothetical protein
VLLHHDEGFRGAAEAVGVLLRQGLVHLPQQVAHLHMLAAHDLGRPAVMPVRSSKAGKSTSSSTPKCASISVRNFP